ncbi:MAG: Clp1/GlmU family protein [Candidatus Helarchaeota archaeon]
MTISNDIIKLSKNMLIQFVGPCNIYVKKGLIEVLGKKLKENEKLTIKNGKALPIDVLEDSIISFSGNKWVILNPEETMKDLWNDLLNRIISMKTKKSQVKIFVVGKVDSGKTTLITWLVNKIIEIQSSVKIGIIDMDMGQGDISPPTTIALGIVDDYIINNKSIKLERMEFIGNVTPSRNLLRCIIGLYNLLDAARNLDYIFIDTTGWVNDSTSRIYKTSKIKIINPDLIININEMINGNVKTYPMLIPLLNLYEIYPIKKSNYIYPRNRETRRNIRENALSRYFFDSKTIRLNFSETPILYTRLGLGEHTPKEIIEFLESNLNIRVIYSEISSECLLILCNKQVDFTKIDLNSLKYNFNVSEIRIYYINDIIGFLVGLFSNNGLLGLGIVQKYDFENKILEILTPVKENILYIEFGSMKILNNGTEICYFQF